MSCRYVCGTMVLLVSASSGEAEQRAKVAFIGLELRENNAVVFLELSNDYIGVALVEVLLGRLGAQHRAKTRWMRTFLKGRLYSAETHQEVVFETLGRGTRAVMMARSRVGRTQMHVKVVISCGSLAVLAVDVAFVRIPKDAEHALCHRTELPPRQP